MASPQLGTTLGPKAEGQPCAATGCATKILAGMLMCRRHWRALPAELKAEVNDSWRAYLRASAVVGVAKRQGTEQQLDQVTQLFGAARARYELARNAAVATAGARR